MAVLITIFVCLFSWVVLLGGVGLFVSGFVFF